MSQATARILVFAKAPVPGQVKTRLIPALGAQAAADLQAELLCRLIEGLGPAPPAPVELWCAPDPSHELFQQLAERHGLTLHRQRGRDLGERLSAAASEAARRASHVILIGADCPALDRSYIEQALTALAAGRHAVLGPAEDGGYVLLGLRRAAASLFQAMPWGGPQVADLTRERMSRLGWSWAELPTLWDLDRPADLERWSKLSPQTVSDAAPAPARPCCRSRPGSG